MNDTKPPSIIQSPQARDAYTERVSILSEGAPITDSMRMIALTEALEVDRILKGELRL